MFDLAEVKVKIVIWWIHEAIFELVWIFSRGFDVSWFYGMRVYRLMRRLIMVTSDGSDIYFRISAISRCDVNN